LESTAIGVAITTSGVVLVAVLVGSVVGILFCRVCNAGGGLWERGFLHASPFSLPAPFVDCFKDVLVVNKRIRLWERDYCIISDLEHGLCTTTQVSRLYFSSNNKKASERLKLLFEHGLVGRFPKPLLDVRGKPEFVYCKKGRVVRGYAKVNHSLAVSEFRIAFLLWLRSCKDFSGSFFYASQLPDSLFGGSLVADGIFILEKGVKKLLYFFECDLGFESLAGGGAYSFADKLDLYAEYFDSGRYRKDFGWLNYQFKGFRVLVVFDCEKRLGNFLRIASEKQADFVLVSMLVRLRKEFVGRVWVGVDGGLVSLVGR
jgi:hypothetical protein